MSVGHDACGHVALAPAVDPTPLRNISAAGGSRVPTEHVIGLVGRSGGTFSIELASSGARTGCLRAHRRRVCTGRRHKRASCFAWGAQEKVCEGYTCSRPVHTSSSKNPQNSDGAAVAGKGRVATRHFVHTPLSSPRAATPLTTQFLHPAEVTGTVVIVS